MDYKIIFSDLDGTLLNSNHQISSANIKAIGNLSVPFIMVSARMPRGINCFKDQLGIDYPVCAYNGAYITHHNKTLHNQTIPSLLVAKILQAIDKDNVHISIYQQDDWFIEKNDQYSNSEQRITNIKPSIVSFSCLEMTNVNKILLISSIVEIDAALVNLAPFNELVTIAKSKPDYLEITPLNTSKDIAVKIVCDYYGLALDHAVAIGDNYNDEPMINAVGLGIFLNNCPEPLKTNYNICEYSNDQDGVAAIINEHFNNQT